MTLFSPHTEIRLEIYPYLLIATSFDEGLAELEIPASKAIALEIYCTRNKKTACRRVCRSIDICTSRGLTPQIQCTCRIINQEATPILYRGNVFQFQLRDTYRPWEDDTTERFRLESLYQSLYHNNVESWIEKASEARIRSDFAVFLRQIGRQKAASVRRLKFLKNKDTLTSPKAQQAGWAIEVVTQLLKCYAPGVRQIKICHVPVPEFGFIEREVYVHWDEFEYGPFEPSPNYLETLEGMRLPPALWDSDDAHPSLFSLLKFRPNSVRLEEEKAIYQAIIDMVQEITWLTNLRVTGLDGDDQIRRRVDDLQTLVKNRS